MNVDPKEVLKASTASSTPSEATVQKIPTGKKMNPEFWHTAGFALPLEVVVDWMKKRNAWGREEHDRPQHLSWICTEFMRERVGDEAERVNKRLVDAVISNGDEEEGIPEEVFCITQAYHKEPTYIDESERRAAVDPLVSIEETDGLLREYLRDEGLPEQCLQLATRYTSTKTVDWAAA